MVTVVDPFEGGMELAFELPGNPLAEDLGNLLGGQLQETEFAGAFEKFVNGKGLAKDEVQTIFDLAEGIEAAKIHGLALPFGELGTQEKCPGIKSFLEELRGQTVGSLLEGLGVLHGQKGIILLSERETGSIQFGFEKGMTVNPVGGLKRKKGSDSQDHRTQVGIPDVEVVMGKAASSLA
jgi:hypothetical protein